MKVLVCAIAVVAAAGAFGTRAEAQNYPWCAQYSGGPLGGGQNCGFTTFEQCLATVRGTGGFCNRNTQYVPPPGPHDPPVAQRRIRKHYPQH